MNRHGHALVRSQPGKCTWLAWPAATRQGVAVERPSGAGPSIGVAPCLVVNAQADARSEGGEPFGGNCRRFLNRQRCGGSEAVEAGRHGTGERATTRRASGDVQREALDLQCKF